MVERLFSRRICFEHISGDLLYPVRVHSRASGQDLFRVWDRLQSEEREVEEEEMLRLVLDHNYAVRMRTLDGSRHGGYRATGQSIVSVHRFDEAHPGDDGDAASNVEAQPAMASPRETEGVELTDVGGFVDSAGEDAGGGFTVTSPSLGELREARLREGTVRYFERGEGEPLLFVHGLLANADAWRDDVPALSASYRCIAPDWPLGAHHPAMGAHTDLSARGMARLILAFLDHLGVERATLVGRGVGVTYCRLAAAMAPERIERVVIAHAAAPDNLPLRSLRPLMLLARAPRAMVLLAYLLQLSLVQRVVARLADDQSEEPLPPTFRPLRYDPRVRRDLRKVLRGLSTIPAKSLGESDAVPISSGVDVLLPFAPGEDQLISQSMYGNAASAEEGDQPPRGTITVNADSASDGQHGAINAN